MKLIYQSSEANKIEGLVSLYYQVVIIRISVNLDLWIEYRNIIIYDNIFLLQYFK